MSSHHVVNDQQEPAVVLLDPGEFGWERLSGLFEWSPVVVVVAPAVEEVLSWGIKLDLILAPKEYQQAHRELLESQYPLRFLESHAGHFAADALHYLLTSGHQAAHLVGFDPVNFSALSLFLQKMDLTVLYGSKKYYPAKTGTFKKWFAKGNISLIGREGLSLKINRKEETDQLTLKGSVPISMALEEGFAQFTAADTFWIGEAIP